MLAKHLLLSNLIAVIDGNWGHFGAVLERGRPQGEQPRREHLKVLLDFVNEHREDAHARPIAAAELEAVERAVDRLGAVLDGALRG